MTVRDATTDDLDDICALITELAGYEGLADEVTCWARYRWLAAAQRLPGPPDIDVTRHQ